MADKFTLDDEPAALNQIEGFRTGSATCGSTSKALAVGAILCTAEDGSGTAILSQNPLRSASVSVSAKGADAGTLRAVIFTIGNANTFTGEDGVADANELVSLGVSGFSLKESQVLVASCGEVGERLPMGALRDAVSAACGNAAENGEADLSESIAAAGGACKSASLTGTMGRKTYRIAGISRPASLSELETGGRFAFFVTDAAVASSCLNELLVAATETTYDKLMLDNGTGTNDTLCILASGKAENELVDNVFSAGDFVEALAAVATQILSADGASGPPASLPIEVRVSKARSAKEADAAARAVAGSLLVKAALQEGKPVGGHILAAAGKSGATVKPETAIVKIGGEVVFEADKAVSPLSESIREKIGGEAFVIEVELGSGKVGAVAYTARFSAGGRERVALAEKAAREAEAVASADVKAANARAAESAAAGEAAAVEIKGLNEKLETARRAADETKSAAQKSLADAAKKAEADLKVVGAKLKEAESSQKSMEKTSEDLTKRLDATERFAAEAKAKAEMAIAATEEKAKAKIEALEAKLAKAEAERKAALEESKEKAQRLKILEKPAAKAVEAADEATKKALESAEAERKSLETKLKEAEASRDSAERKAAGASAKAAAAEQTAADASKQKDEAVAAAKKSAEAEREALEAKLKESEAARNAAVQDAEAAAKRIEAAGRPAEKAIAAAEEASKKVHEASEAELKSARAELAAAEAARDAASVEAKSLTAKLADTQTGASAAKETAAKTAGDASATAKAEREALDVRLAQATSEAEDARRSMEEVGKNLHAAEAHALEAKAAAEKHLEAAKASAAAEAEALQAKLKKAESSREALAQELEELKGGQESGS